MLRVGACFGGELRKLRFLLRGEMDFHALKISQTGLPGMAIPWRHARGRLIETRGANLGAWAICSPHSLGSAFVESHICQNRADMGHPGFHHAEEASAESHR
jgi:hypothetical protein